MNLCSRQRGGEEAKESHVHKVVEKVENSIQDVRGTCRDCRKEAAVELLKIFVIV